MKITIIQGAFFPVPPVLGGAIEKMWFALGKEFARKGHKVFHISRSFDNLPKEEWIDGVFHKRLKGYDTPSSGVYLKLLDLLYTFHIRPAIPSDSEVIITNTFWAPIILPLKLRERCIVDVQRMPKGQMRFYKRVSRFRANSTSVVTSIESELSPAYHNKIINIPNPLPFEEFCEIDFNFKKPLLLYVGRIHPEKGLDLLIKAYQKSKCLWKLIIVGPSETGMGGGGSSYIKSLKILANNSNIEILDPIFNIEKLNQFYIEASVFMYPSLAEKGETFGLAPLEAMSYGCVPIVSDLACFQDFINHQSNGIIFDHRANNAVDLLSDSIRQLTENNVYRNKLGHESLKVRQSHPTAMIAGQFLELFNKVISERNN